MPRCLYVATRMNSATVSWAHLEYSSSMSLTSLGYQTLTAFLWDGLYSDMIEFLLFDCERSYSSSLYNVMKCSENIIELYQDRPGTGEIRESG